MTLEEQIDFFFAPPLPHANRHATESSLLGEAVRCRSASSAPLSRRTPILTHPAKRHRLFSTVMAIISGIDLLAKFYAGSDDKGEE